jgi:hypothetical protein|tara:strand:- start:408 stop:593 length:186 start_codon:yes stop_codon:yes gene_type:complete
LKTKLENNMTLKKISDDWYGVTLKRQGKSTLTFFGPSKKEVVGRLKQHLSTEDRNELSDSI